MESISEGSRLIQVRYFKKLIEGCVKKVDTVSMALRSIYDYDLNIFEISGQIKIFILTDVYVIKNKFWLKNLFLVFRSYLYTFYRKRILSLTTANHL